MTNQLGSISKVAVLFFLRKKSRSFLAALKQAFETEVRIDGILGDIQTRHLKNAL